MAVINIITFYEIRRYSFSVKNNREDVEFRPHIHSDIEILYMRSGKQYITVEDNTYCLNEGDAAVIFPEVNHSYVRKTESGQPADEILIICSEKIYKTFLADIGNSKPADPIIRAEKISADAKYAFSVIDKSTSADMRLAWMIIVILNLMPCLKLEHKKPFPVESISYKIVKYIEENFTAPITIESVAKALSVSKSYVSRIFSENVKMNFRRYVGALRAEYAAKLIRTTQDSLTAISENSGFESQSTFNRTFRSIYGVTPREFRRNIEKYYKA